MSHSQYINQNHSSPSNQKGDRTFDCDCRVVQWVPLHHTRLQEYCLSDKSYSVAPSVHLPLYYIPFASTQFTLNSHHLSTHLCLIRRDGVSFSGLSTCTWYQRSSMARQGREDGDGLRGISTHPTRLQPPPPRFSPSRISSTMMDLTCQQTKES